MNKKHYRFRNIPGFLLLIICCGTFAQAQPASGSTQPSQPGNERQRPNQSADRFDRSAVEQAIEQPYNSVLVRIRFKKEYGYKSESAQGGPGLGSCDAFTIGLANAVRPSVPNVLIPIRRPERISEVHGYYHCEFLISGLALDQDVTVNASVDDQEPWLGSTQPLPSGYQRALTDQQRTVSLSQGMPRATMNFEVIYVPRSKFVEPRRSSNPLLRKP